MKKLSVLIVLALLLNISPKVFAEEIEFQAVSYTSPITLHWLAKAGIPEAVEYIGNLSAKNILDQTQIKDKERVERANSVYQEIKYSSLNNFIESEGYTTIMDLGCGVSPRGIYMVRKGLNYYGIELEAVTRVLEEYTPMFLNDNEEKLIHFATADVTDREAMLKSVENAPGKICIISENLSLYLSIERQKAMLENIREILKIHGGCFVTSDHLSDVIFFESASAIYGKKTAESILDESIKIYENTSEMDFYDTYFDTSKEAMDFIKAQGFNVEVRPLFTKPQDLYSIKSLNDKQIKQIKKFMTKKMLWVMTVK